MQEKVYGISSLSPRRAGASRIAPLVRGHWAIENTSHWRRDVTLGKDQSQIRTRGVPTILSLLNSPILALLDLLGVRNVPAQMRRSDAHPWEALQ